MKELAEQMRADIEEKDRKIEEMEKQASKQKPIQAMIAESFKKKIGELEMQLTEAQKKITNRFDDFEF